MTQVTATWVPPVRVLLLTTVEVMPLMAVQVLDVTRPNCTAEPRLAPAAARQNVPSGRTPMALPTMRRPDKLLVPTRTPLVPPVRDRFRIWTRLAATDSTGSPSSEVPVFGCVSSSAGRDTGPIVAWRPLPVPTDWLDSRLLA